MKPVEYSFNAWNFSEFWREGGHILIRANLFASPQSFMKIPFILDTGAYISVLRRARALQAGIELTGIYSANLTGFNRERGFDKAEIVSVPKVEIGKFSVEDVRILVPLEDIEIPEVIGENILEYFIYAVDHDRDRIYFAKNPNPKPYIAPEKGIDLSCGRVLAQE